MSADGSATNLDLSTNTRLAPALSDVIRELERDTELDPNRCRELCSALRKVCSVLRLDVGSVPAAPQHLRLLLAPITAAMAGVTKGRWGNIRSLVFKALRHVGLCSMPGRYCVPLNPEWQRLRGRLPDRHERSGLSRFISYCSARDIEPAGVTAETFALFGAGIDASMARDPGGVYRDTCKLWNKAVDTVRGWPQLRVAVPNRRREFALPVDRFPPSFQTDLDCFMSERANPDVFSDTYCKPIRATTAKTRRQRILMAATALVETGFPVDQLTGLDVLVEPKQAKAALRFLFDRGGKKTGYLHHIAILLKTVAKYYVRKDEKTVGVLSELCHNLRPKQAGLTEKNKRFLHQFADSQKLGELLMLPQRLLAEADRQGGHHRGAAVKVALALAIGIELVIPIRQYNLGGLRSDRHLHRAGKSFLLSISADETKNDNPIEAELPSWLVRIMDRYIDHYRPRLVTAPSPWLFPGEDGKRRSSGFGVQIGKLIAEEIGVVMTPHQFRHLAAKLYLDRRPGDYETVRRLLGHKSIVTTMKFYRELDTVLAVQRYGELITQFMEETAGAITKPRGHSRDTEQD
jgi:hypothetical protein